MPRDVHSQHVECADRLAMLAETGRRSAYRQRARSLDDEDAQRARYWDGLAQLYRGLELSAAQLAVHADTGLQCFGED